MEQILRELTLSFLLTLIFEPEKKLKYATGQKRGKENSPRLMIPPYPPHLMISYPGPGGILWKEIALDF